MNDTCVPIQLDLPDEAQAALIEGARDIRPIAGLTHNFYRYPARFSPAFARAAIETFTKPGDLVLDPYVGGGTTLVEALALGRHGWGIDISQLAEFVATVKTTVLEEKEIGILAAWAADLPNVVHLRRSSIYFAAYAERGYYKHLDHPSRWRLRKAVEQVLGSAIRLQSTRLETFARCVVLRTAQWALDGRSKLPSIVEFRDMLLECAPQMINGARALRATVDRHPAPPRVCIINRSAAGLEEEPSLREMPSPRLVVTSPPYPGIHVLYHRWQVDGRKETAAPFWIANKFDGAGSSYYTMGDRKFPELRTYFDSLRATMSSVASLCDSRTTIVQMVAFSDPSWQLARYLEVMEEAGFSEALLPMLKDDRDGRLWRSVPNRRWYADQRGKTPSSEEVVLVHRKRATVAMQPLQRSRTSSPLRRPAH